MAESSKTMTINVTPTIDWLKTHEVVQEIVREALLGFLDSLDADWDLAEPGDLVDQFLERRTK